VFGYEEEKQKCSHVSNLFTGKPVGCCESSHKKDARRCGRGAYAFNGLMEWVVSESKQIAKSRQTYLSASYLDESQQSAEAGSSLLTDPARGVVDEFGGIPQAEFLPDVHAVCVHGLDAQMQTQAKCHAVPSLAQEGDTPRTRGRSEC
jgi:hypothetical protein